jgi:hypothetical protein
MEEHAARNGTGADLRAANAEFEAAMKRQRNAEQAASAPRAAWQATTAVRQSCQRLLSNSKINNGDGVTYKVSPAAPVIERGKGSDYDIVAECRRDIAAAADTLELADTSYPPKDLFLTRTLAGFNTLKEDGKFTISARRSEMRQDPGQIELEVKWPVTRDFGFLNERGDFLATIHTAGLLARMFPDQIRELIAEAVDAYYTDIDNVMEPGERLRTMRELKAQILEIERRECAAIWRLWDAGDFSFDFRAETSPKAVLGIA